MSGRTIAVGILAAICGIFATVGVTMLRESQPAAPLKPEKQILVALVEIATGQKIEPNMLESIPWYSDVLPANAIVDPADVVGQYAVTTVMTGDLIVKEKISLEKSDLMPAPGKLAFTIESRTASSNVGANLTAGNRVDILWNSKNASANSDRPVTVRLLNNVKILGIGQVAGKDDKTQKSLTFELNPKMDENLMFAQSHGELALALRNPVDVEDFEPLEVTNLASLMKEYELRTNTPQPPSAWDVSLKLLMKRFSDLEKSFNQKDAVVVVEAKVPDRKTVDRIKEGMRAFTIQTPNESNALAGLLEPGDRVDLVLTLNFDKSRTLAVDEKTVGVPTETLIKNIEILAVDTKLQVLEGEDEKKMSTSVTLLFKTEMIHDVAQASGMGTLTLPLRGNDEDDGPDPITELSLDEFIQMHVAVAEPTKNEMPLEEITSKIRTIRGGSVNEIAVASGTNARN